MKTAICVVILLILGAGILFGVLRARKKSLSTAISRLILTLAALIPAILACVFLSRFLSGRLLAVLTTGIPELSDSVGYASEIEGVFRAFCSAGIALVLFLILYPIAVPLCRIAVKPLSRLLDRLIPALSESKTAPAAAPAAPVAPAESTDGAASDSASDSAVKTPDGSSPTPSATPQSGSKGKNLRLAIRLAVGGLCGLILSVLLLSPLTGLLRIAGDALAFASAMEQKENPDAEQPFDGLIEVCDALPVRAVGWLGGTPVCRALTVSRFHGVRIDPITECDLLSDLADYLSDPAEHKGRFSTYSKAVGKSAILNRVFPDLLERMFDSWASGETAMGMTPPEFLEVGLKDGLLDRELLTRDTLSRSMTAFLDLSVYILDNGGFTDADMDRLMTDEERLSEFYACIIGAPPLHGFLRSFLTSGIGAMVEEWDGIEPMLSGGFSEDEEEIEKEARALAHATVVMVNFQNSYSLDAEHLEDTLHQLGQVLDDLKQTDLIEQDGLQQLAESALRSESVQQALNFDSQKTEEVIEQIRRDSASRDFAELLAELVEK